MDDLVQWLRAQLDDDERTARAATPGPWKQSGIGEYGWGVSFSVPGTGVEAADSDQGRPDADHIARHDPTRVLREIDAKRRTLIRCEEALLSANPMLVHFAKQTAWEMAQPYADRPGYRDEWRP
ncbi:DUF6221 family protein [Streptomyces tendae]|uniref:DUF6221 family protein n=1 Tax=Streptomyces tendae TaxID=1932 RepID=UPI003715944B